MNRVLAVILLAAVVAVWMIDLAGVGATSSYSPVTVGSRHQGSHRALDEPNAGEGNVSRWMSTPMRGAGNWDGLGDHEGKTITSRGPGSGWPSLYKNGKFFSTAVAQFWPTPLSKNFPAVVGGGGGTASSLAIAGLLSGWSRGWKAPSGYGVVPWVALAFLFQVSQAMGTTVFAGQSRTCALHYGKVACWGNGADGTLGTGNTNSLGLSTGQMASLTPIVFGTQSPVKSIALSLSFLNVDHTCVLFENGQGKCFGVNTNGECGNGGKVTPALVTSDLALFSMQNITFTQVMALQYTTCVLSGDGRVMCWGSGQNYGTLGRGNNLPYMFSEAAFIIFAEPTILVTSISGTHLHVCALFSNKKVKCWGLNNGVCNIFLDIIIRSHKFKLGTMWSRQS